MFISSTEKITTIILSIYAIGFVSYAIHSIYLKSLDTPENMAEMSRHERTAWNLFLITRPLLWPKYFLKINPLESLVIVMSMLFFRNYGDSTGKGRHQTYGFYYFLKDLFSGKQRYDEYTKGQWLIRLSPESPLLDIIGSDTLREYCHYVQVTYGFHEKKADYRLHYFFITSPDIARDHVSSYVLDDSNKRTREKFFNELFALDPALSQAVMKKLSG